MAAGALAGLALLAIAATQVTPGLRISRYPRVTTLDDTDIIVAARTNVVAPAPATNVGIVALNLLRQATNGLASTGYVNTVGTTVSNGAVNFTVNLVTNTSNSLSTTISNASNFVATSFVKVATNIDRMVLQAIPVSGSEWYVGTNGTPLTNGQRRGFEFDGPKASIRFGMVGHVGVFRHHYLADSNFWNAENVQLGSSVLGGSNNLANAIYSTVAGGVGNLIYTNAPTSYIGGGTNNLIATNAYASVINGGENSAIHVNSDHGVIGGGYSAIIGGGSPYSTISGGAGNQILGGGASSSTIGGGLNNTVSKPTAGSIVSATISGGSQNVVRGSYTTISGGRINTMHGVSDASVISGGESHNIGNGGSGGSGVLNATITGGNGNLIDGAADYSVVGGRANTVNANSTNSTISGGAFHTINANSKFSAIGGGERNTITGTYGVIPGGASNSVTAARAWALGNGVTNNTADAVMASEFVSYNTPSVIAGAGSGSTNYTLQLTSPEMVLGSSNVNIVAAMGWIDGKTHKWNVSITNLSGDNWGFSFQQTSNRVKWQSWMYGTNAPSVLTNNTVLRISGTSTGSNTLAEFKYFSPAL